MPRRNPIASSSLAGSIGAFMLFDQTARARLRTPGPWLMAVGFLVVGPLISAEASRRSSGPLVYYRLIIDAPKKICVGVDQPIRVAVAGMAISPPIDPWRGS